jgi:molybdopterin-guanine dinucleotide biosynthesis protein A
MHKDCLHELQRFFVHGGRAVHLWLEHMNCAWVDFSDQASTFRNFNTLEHLAAV